MFVVTLLHGTRTHTRSACIPPFCLRPLPEWPHTRAAAKSFLPRQSKINTDIPRDAKICCQHGLPAALPSTPKHGTVHALIFLVLSQPFGSHIPRWADAHKSTPQKATVIAHALAMSVGVCMDPLLTRAGRQPAAGALVPVHRIQHEKRK
ncbi:hypothetical protein Tc00.1047053511451.10 [Trypanosoma cruzi]|uniref:Uncharacterized protein n=1 Tax=Trypanosoma cruzi (strain CL Brener) TaxID=353153 RepID=Q4DEH1_TRYCC|nr:hypothetical protein Tc00.1047053511451.10 [Trypanosoma cruzi]EAN90918.1 hypothetical protein Tc00.1047053511451.10 [Trypanosoma cruzi]|eukprot:XP_812769.1 hypothetical protein [Trypanosoma cruzi strain CL Brener]